MLEEGSVPCFQQWHKDGGQTAMLADLQVYCRLLQI